MKQENIDIINNKFQTIYLYNRLKNNTLLLNTSDENLNHIEYMLLRIENVLHIDSRIENSWVILNSEVLKTIIGYMNDEYAISNPKYFPELKGKYFSELKRKYQRRIEDYQFNSIIIRPNTKYDEAIDLIKYLTK